MRGLSDIVRTVSRYAAAPLIVFGAYLFTHATHSHGVGFAGGVIIALTVMMLLIAFGRAPVSVTMSTEHAVTAAIIAAVSLLVVAAFTTYGGISMLPMTARDPFTLYAVFTLNILLCLAAACALIAVFFAFMKDR